MLINIELEKLIVNNLSLNNYLTLLFFSEKNIIGLVSYMEKFKCPTTREIDHLVENGFYNGIKFHRVIDGFMIQGGDPLSKNDSLMNRWGTGGSEPIEDEFIKGLSNVRGTLSMANAGPNSGSSQFFINTQDNIQLDWDKAPMQSKHPVFGKVIEGMDIVDKISKVKTNAMDRPIEHIVIEKAYMK